MNERFRKHPDVERAEALMRRLEPGLPREMEWSVYLRGGPDDPPGPECVGVCFQVPLADEVLWTRYEWVADPWPELAFVERGVRRAIDRLAARAGI